MPAADRANLSASLASVTETGATLTPQDRLIVYGVSFAIGLLAAILFFLEMRSTNTTPLIPVVTAEGKGDTKVSGDAIVQRLRYSIDQIQDVVEVNPAVQRRGDGVEVLLNVRTGPDIDVRMKDEEIKQVAKQIVEEQMGLRLKKLVIKIDHAPYAQAQPS
jgi:hypothetical protein